MVSRPSTLWLARMKTCASRLPAMFAMLAKRVCSFAAMEFAITVSLSISTRAHVRSVESGAMKIAICLSICQSIYPLRQLGGVCRCFEHPRETDEISYDLSTDKRSIGKSIRKRGIVNFFHQPISARAHGCYVTIRCDAIRRRVRLYPCVFATRILLGLTSRKEYLRYISWVQRQR